jgi:predicted hydrocarbon binding protein
MTSLPFLTTTRTVQVPVELLSGLRTLARGEASPAMVAALRDLGYAAGQAQFDQFTHWLADHGEAAVDLLPEGRFATLASQFFAEQGWGAITVSEVSEAVLAIDATDWAEAEGATPTVGAQPSCHVGTGLLAGFFGRVADAPLAVLEVECRAAGDARCRFLLGSIDVLSYVHEAMGRGIPYERAAASA